MSARAYWQGHLRLSLVSIGVELYSAVASSNRLVLHQIHEPSGKRVRYQKVAPGVGPVDRDEIVKGFEYGKDQYVLLEPEELSAIRLASEKTIDLVQFVDACEIDPRYFERPYYVVPADNKIAAEGFAVMREALRASKKVGLGQLAQRGRDHIVAIRPCGDGMLLETLRYADELRASDQIFAAIPEVEPEDEMLDLAAELIARKSAPFEPQAFRSQYELALRELIDSKRETGAVMAATDVELADPQNRVIDLMEALKKSVAADRPAASGNGARNKRSRKAG